MENPINTNIHPAELFQPVWCISSGIFPTKSNLSIDINHNPDAIRENVRASMNEDIKWASIDCKHHFSKANPK